MAKFRVAVEWVMMAEQEFEADSLEDAIQQAEEAPLPKGTYVDGSFQINPEVTDQLN